jgi:hypothetical protein
MRPKVDNNISYQTLNGEKLPGSYLAISPNTVSNAPIVPISTLRVVEEKNQFPTKKDLEIYRLQRQVAALKDDKRELNDKVSSALSVISDTIRFFELGLHDDQWENFSQIQQRIANLRGIAARISDFKNRENPEIDKLLAKSNWKGTK